MDVRNCKRCNQIFQYWGNDNCPSCVQELDDIFIKVRDYIYDNPKANVVEVSRATEVEEDIILRFLKEGRLELSSPSIGFACERCGVSITTGRYCNECIGELDREMKKGLGEATRRPQRSRDSSGMYTADYRKRKFEP